MSKTKVGSRQKAVGKEVHFEDKGQDFLKWTIAPDGKILNSEPFQYSIWSKYKVMNYHTMEVGNFIILQQNKKMYFVHYRIAKIKKVTI